MQNSKSYAMPLTIIRWFFATLARDLSNISVTLRLDGIEFGGPINGFTGFGYACRYSCCFFFDRNGDSTDPSFIWCRRVCFSPWYQRRESSSILFHWAWTSSSCCVSFRYGYLTKLTERLLHAAYFSRLNQSCLVIAQSEILVGNFDEQSDGSPGKSAWRFLRNVLVPMCGFSHDRMSRAEADPFS